MLFLFPRRMSSSELGAIVVGYFAACSAAAVLMIMTPFLTGLLGGAALEFSLVLFLGLVFTILGAFLIALVVSLPGFILLRYALYLLQRSDFVSFYFAGSLQAWLVLVLTSSAKPTFQNAVRPFQDPVGLFIVFGIGGLAGLTAWVVERADFVVEEN
jgi:hypothetical protein